MNVEGDIDNGGTWLTYSEIAKARGVKRVAAIRLVQRHKWRKQPGNDGMTKVLVPVSMIQAAGRIPRDISGNDTGNDTGSVTGSVAGDSTGYAAAFEAALAALSEQQSQERAGWQAERDRLLIKVDHFEAETAAQRDEIADLRAKVTALEQERTTRALSRWARIRAAWGGK
jgi:hypothetical protein